VTRATYVLLLILAAVAWAHVLGSDMAGSDMAGMGMPMAPTLAGGLLYVAGWTVMMAAMMLPSAAPMIALYAATQGNVPGVLARTAAVVAFALVYVALWAATGVPGYVLSEAMMAIGPKALAYGVAATLIVAGIFQFTPLKQVCLRRCRSPMGFLVAAGAMGLAWVVLIAALVAVEKLAPGGERIARLIGMGLVLLGLAVAVRPQLAMLLRAGGHG
jgi:predicted metal-binding membrane protein